MAAKSSGHRWTFPARFRRRGFAWRSQPAIQRVRHAVNEILRVARKDPLLGSEGAVMFLERVAPALEQVDSSSGAMGSAVILALDGFVHHRDHGLDEVDRDEVWMTLTRTLHAAESCGQTQEVRARVRELAGRGMGPVRTILISGLGPEDGGERREPDA